MNYIIFDLEWNQAADISKSDDELHFEIIEIAAIKLNSKFEKVSEFQRIIRPCVYKEISPIIGKITGFTELDLQNGISFRQAAKEFIQWCGLDYTFCTWSTQDLSELQNNLRYYDMKLVDKPPLFYYDIQKFFSITYENGIDRRSLEYAVDFLKINKKVQFHRAYADAYYTAEVFKMIDLEKVKDDYSIDTFVAPSDKSEEFKVIYDKYTKYVYRTFSDKDQIINDKDIMSVKCNKCGQLVKRKIGWFSDGMKTYYFLGKCAEHGLIKAKLRIKKSVLNDYYSIKIVKNIDENEFDIIRNKKIQIVQKRKNHRKPS